MTSKEKNCLNKAIANALNATKQSDKDIALITGGPTCEDIDAVRFLSNRSTGRMGIECAVAAKELGLLPILILGPTHLEVDSNEILVINVRSAAMMHHAVEKIFEKAKFVVMSAAVADFTPMKITTLKLKKADIEDENHELTLKLKRTVDILSSLSVKPERKDKYIAGFSLDTNMNISEGKRKLANKSLDLIVVNSTEAFAAADSHITLITKDNNVVETKNNSKLNTAKLIITELLTMSKTE